MVGNNGDRKSLSSLVLRHPFKVLSAVSISNIKMFLSVAHFSGFRAAVDTTRNVLNNSMDDFDRMENIREYTGDIGDVPDHLTIPFFDEPLVSVVIPVHNQYAFTVSCIHSVIVNTEHVPYEVILGDDCSTDETVDIGSCVDNMEVVRAEVNGGFIVNCNSCAARARGKYILFLNNDTVVGPDWLRPLVDAAESSERVGVVGSKLLYPDGKLQEAGGIIWNDGTATNYGKGDNPTKPKYNYVKEVDYVSGASLLVRRDIFEQLGGFDTRYVPAYCEDSDLCIAVRNLGYSVLYQPLSTVVHFEGMTHGKKKPQVAVNPLQETNIVKLRDKWSEYLRDNCLPPMSDMFHARDRSRGRKTILFLSDHIPSKDMDSGSRMTFTYLNVLSEMGFNVKLTIGDFHYDHNYATPLEQARVEIYYGIENRDYWKKFLRKHGRDFDHAVVVGYSCADRFMEYLEKHTRAKIHYFLRNNVIVGLERENGLTEDKHVLLQLAVTKRRNRNYLALADSCICVSDDDVTYFEGWSTGTKFFTIPYSRYTDDMPLPERRPSAKDVVFIGYMGFRPNVDAVVWFIREMMPILRDRLPGVCFHVLGGSVPDSVIEMASDDVVIEGHLEDGRIEEVLSSCLLAVAPMRTSAGVMGSVVDCMYYGVPVVSTPVGLEGLDGLVYPEFSTPEEIAGGIVRISADPEYAKALSDSGRDYVLGKMTAEKMESEFRRIFI